MKYHLVLVTKYRRKCFTSTMLDSLQTSCQSLCDCKASPYSLSIFH
ncbi:transposase [Marinomonas sp. 2405UD68-3]